MTTIDQKQCVKRDREKERQRDGETEGEIEKENWCETFRIQLAADWGPGNPIENLWRPGLDYMRCPPVGNSFALKRLMGVKIVEGEPALNTILQSNATLGMLSHSHPFWVWIHNSSVFMGICISNHAEVPRRRRFHAVFTSIGYYVQKFIQYPMIFCSVFYFNSDLELWI